MIISDNSFFRKPPKVLLPKQIPVFDAITCSIDICEISYKNLIKKLLKFSNNPNVNGQYFQKLYLEIWSIFNNITIFGNIITEHFGIDKKNKLFENFHTIRELRNTIAHIDKRISETLIDKEFPIYGIISWTQNIPNTNNIEQFAISTGTFTDKNKIKGKILGAIKPNKQEIYNINYTGIIRLQKEQFKEVSINIDQIMEQLNTIIIFLEKQIQIEKETERHNTNIYFQISSHWEE